MYLLACVFLCVWCAQVCRMGGVMHVMSWVWSEA